MAGGHYDPRPGSAYAGCGEYRRSLRSLPLSKITLAMMTPQNARIWYISPGEPRNKIAYFVDAPYQVDKISEQTF